jgi:protein-S-isoprenylcysteine O-methyltransferase Ste14
VPIDARIGGAHVGTHGERLSDRVAPRAAASKSPLRVLLHVPVPWVFVLIYLVGICLELAFPLGFGLPGVRVDLAGAACFVLGTSLAGWGLAIFHRNRTTTVPGRTSARLVTWGPYRYARNPMYVGLVLAYIGEAGLMRQLWPVLLLPLVVVYLNSTVIPLEEQRLSGAFPNEYRAYKATVRRWI